MPFQYPCRAMDSGHRMFAYDAYVKNGESVTTVQQLFAIISTLDIMVRFYPQYYSQEWVQKLRTTGYFKEKVSVRRPQGRWKTSRGRWDLTPGDETPSLGPALWRELPGRRLVQPSSKETPGHLPPSTILKCGMHGFISWQDLRVSLHYHAGNR
ncbi:hypothetical protein J6590_023130 [Homalodisca vitripennis]|nr:hypothetical protein J6590_023130 [Homalodisca vitripennis]